MEIDDQLNILRKQCSNGTFSLRHNQLISEVVAQEQVPNEAGVYVIYSVKQDSREIVYIGKAGTLLRNGHLKKQRLAKRLRMKQNGVYRDIFFRGYISDRELDSLEFEWFVTYDDQSKILPFLVEAQLLAAHFAKFASLPELNRQA